MMVTFWQLHRGRFFFSTRVRPVRTKTTIFILSHFPHKGAKRRQLLAGGLGLRYIKIGENSLFFFISRCTLFTM